MDFSSRLKAAFEKKNRWFLINSKQIDHNQFQEFKKLRTMSRSYFGSSLIIVTENRRILPHGDLASRTIGVLNKGVFGGTHGYVGYTGVEGLEENYLAGKNGLALKTQFLGKLDQYSVGRAQRREGCDHDHQCKPSGLCPICH